MPATTTSAIEARRTGTRFIYFAIGAIIAILLIATAFLLLTLPDANAFNSRVEQVFVENSDLTGQAEIRLLEMVRSECTGSVRHSLKWLPGTYATAGKFLLKELIHTGQQGGSTNHKYIVHRIHIDANPHTLLYDAIHAVSQPTVKTFGFQDFSHQRFGH